MAEFSSPAPAIMNAAMDPYYRSDNLVKTSWNNATMLNPYCFYSGGDAPQHQSPAANLMDQIYTRSTEKKPPSLDDLAMRMIMLAHTCYGRLLQLFIAICKKRCADPRLPPDPWVGRS